MAKRKQSNQKQTNLILKMTSKDIAFAHTLVDCRYAPLDMQNEKRIKKWIKSGFIKKTPFMEGKKSVLYAEITTKGWHFLQQNPDIVVTERYSSKKDAKIHDIVLLKERAKALKAGKVWINEKSSIKLLEDRKVFLISNGRINEAERIQKLQDEGKISTPDAIVYDPKTGEYEVVEVITRNYSDDDIEGKYEWARCMNIRDDFECIEAY